MRLRLLRLFSVVLSLVYFAVHASELPTLPEPVANNAVAVVDVGEYRHLISFMGLGKGKTYQDVHNKVWSLQLANGSAWQEQRPVPSSLPLKGRLASVAVGIADKAYLFGGYTVAKDHTEISSPDNFVYDLKSDAYQKIAPTPVPTDDAVAMTYQERYIYLVSGWHNDGNVNLVQVYDVKSDSWQQASPFPGEPVFGHAGGISDNKMLICDGVKVQPREKQRRTFAQVAKCLIGVINSNSPDKIDWQILPHPTGIGKYRMAAAGVQLANNKGIMFVGGSDNPYNYNGIGYNSEPSKPSSDIWFYDLEKEQWMLGSHGVRTMDHRGLLISQSGDKAYIVGGMLDQQNVSNQVAVLNMAKLELTPNK